MEMGKEWIRENEARQAYLEWLYERSGRSDPSHPDHATYGGLVSDRRAVLLREDRWAVLNPSS